MTTTEDARLRDRGVISSVVIARGGGHGGSPPIVDWAEERRGELQVALAGPAVARVTSVTTEQLFR